MTLPTLSEEVFTKLRDKVEYLAALQPDQPKKERKKQDEVQGQVVQAGES